MKQDFEIYGRVDGRSEKHGTKRETEKVARAMTWFEKFIDESGDRAPDEEKMFLPTCYTKEDIYFSYVAQMHSDGFGDSTEIVGKSCFFNNWAQRFYNVAIAPVSLSRKNFQLEGLYDKVHNKKYNQKISKI